MSALKNPTTPYNEKVAIVETIHDKKQTDAVPYLVGLLPGDYDTLTLTIISTLGDLGDSSVLPVLHRMDSKPELLTGKMNGAIKRAIEKIVLRQKR